MVDQTTMKVSKIELFHIAIPLKTPFYPAWIPGYPQTENRFTLLRLTTDTGLTGVSAGVAFAEEREGLGDVLAPYLLGLDPCDTDLVHQRLIELSFLGWRNFWMEAAFYDIKAQAEDKPLWKLLGGTDNPVPVYWSTGAVCDSKTHIPICQQAQREGYAGVKLRVHADTLEEDIQVIQDTRKGVDLDYPLMVDANQGWRVTIVDRTPAWDLKRAQNFVKGVADANIHWLEEPLEMHAYQDLAKLRKTSSIKIAGAELNAGWHDIKMFLHFKSLDLYQPDATVSGIDDILKTLEAIQGTELGFNPHTWTNGVGLWINMHTYALTDRKYPLEFPHEPGSWTPGVRDGILKVPIVPKDGYLKLPQEAGLGLSVDWNKVEQFGKLYFSMTEEELAVKVVEEKGLEIAFAIKERRDKAAEKK